MSTLLYFGTYGYDNPTKATMPFFLATGAIEANHQAQVVLGGEAAVVIQDSIMDEIHGVGIPPLREMVQKLIDHDVPIYV